MTVLFIFKHEIIQKIFIKCFGTSHKIYAHSLSSFVFVYYSCDHPNHHVHSLSLMVYHIIAYNFYNCGFDFGAVLRFMIPKSELVNRSRIDNTMAKEKDKEQTTIYQTLHIKLKI